MTLVMARREQAATTLQIAEKQLSDSLVCAPHDGMITKRMKEPGEFVYAGNPVARIEDPNSLEVLFTLGEEWFTRVVQGVTPIMVTAGESETVETVVAVRFPSVHPVARTVEIKAFLPAGGVFAPGMICDAEVIFARHEGWGIKAEAVGRRSGQPVVFVVENGKAQQCAVKIGLRRNGYIEVLDGDTLAGQQVVVDGQSFLNHGMPVRVVTQD